MPYLWLFAHPGVRGRLGRSIGWLARGSMRNMSCRGRRRSTPSRQPVNRHLPRARRSRTPEALPRARNRPSRVLAAGREGRQDHGRPSSTAGPNSSASSADDHAGVKPALMVVGLARQVTTLARHVGVASAGREKRRDDEEGDVPHAGTTQPSPSRSPRYAPLMTRSHQPLWSRYQRTVWRRPSSKPWRGRQPSAVVILEASMA